MTNITMAQKREYAEDMAVNAVRPRSISLYKEMQSLAGRIYNNLVPPTLFESLSNLPEGAICKGNKLQIVVERSAPIGGRSDHVDIANRLGINFGASEVVYIGGDKKLPFPVCCLYYEGSAATCSTKHLKPSVAKKITEMATGFSRITLFRRDLVEQAVDLKKELVEQLRPFRNLKQLKSGWPEGYESFVKHMGVVESGKQLVVIQDREPLNKILAEIDKRAA